MEKRVWPKVSVLIATYNASKTLLRALESVSSQTYSDVELIIIDGASKDDTIIIAREFDFDSKIIISEPDSGIYDALNKGVKAASGEWVYVLGADDELLPDGISSLMKHSDGYDCVYGDVYIRDTNGGMSLFSSKPASVLPRAMCCSHQAIIMKRNVIIQQGGFDLQFRISADYDLILRTYLAGYKFCQTHEKIAYFAKDLGASASLNMYVIKEQYRLYKKNNATSCPLLAVIWNFIKRVIRNFYDPKKRI